MSRLHHIRVKFHHYEEDSVAVLTTTDGVFKRAFWRVYNSGSALWLRRATLNFLFPVHINIRKNHLPEHGYTCKVREGFIDMQMWRLRYPDGQVEFHSAKVPCAPMPPTAQRVSLRQRARLISHTPEVQQTFDAWLKANTFLQLDEVSQSADPLAALNKGVCYGTASSVRKGRWSFLRWGRMEGWANGVPRPAPVIAWDEDGEGIGL